TFLWSPGPSVPRGAVHRHLHSFPPRRSSDLLRAYADRVKHTGRHRSQMWREFPVTTRLLYVGIIASSVLSLTSALLIVLYDGERSEEHTSELQSRENLVCRLLLEKKTTRPGG